LRNHPSRPGGFYCLDETCNVGEDEGSPVSPDYRPRGNGFSGTVNWVQIDLGLDDHDHLISPEARFQVAMAKHNTRRTGSPKRLHPAVEMTAYRCANIPDF
jgi:hypothetical protein